MDETLIGTASMGHHESGSDDKEQVLHSFQCFRAVAHHQMQSIIIRRILLCCEGTYSSVEDAVGVFLTQLIV